MWRTIHQIYKSREGLVQIGRITTTGRRNRFAKIGAMARNLVPGEPIVGTVELDSHADTTVFGKNFLILHYTGRECDVMPYSDTYESIKGVPIVTAATAWTCQDSGETYILVFHEGLWMGESMPNTLINPNQLRAYGCTVQDNPYCGSPLYLEDSNGTITIPLSTIGTNILTTTRTPTQDELDNCTHIIWTSQREWEPSNIVFPAPKWTIAEDKAGRISSITTKNENMEDEERIFNVNDFTRRLIASCKVTSIPTRRSVSNVVVSDVPTPNTFVSGDRKSDVTPQSLSERWMIGLDTAKQTLEKTTQRLVRSAVLPLSRRYKADRIFQLPRLQGTWFSDTVDGRVKSKDGNKYAQIFANEAYFATIYPMDTKSKAGDALRTFCREFGVPTKLIVDGSREQTGKHTEFMRQIRTNDIELQIAEAGLHNQSPAEGVVREVRRRWYRTMFKKRVPKEFWDYGMRWVCETMQRTYVRGHRINGCVPLQALTGETIDISEYLDFGFYDRVWYHENAGLGEPMPARWLGVSKHVGGQMCFYVLTKTGHVVSRSSVWRATNLELQTETSRRVFDELDALIKGHIRDDNFPVDGDKPDPEMWADLADTDADFREEFFKVYGDETISEADDFSPEIMDNTYLNMELTLPRDGEEPAFARVKKRLKDDNGNPIGTANQNPILDTRMFEVEFTDGTTMAMTANTIAENMFAQVDEEGHRFVLIDEIVDHRTSRDAVQQADAFLTTGNGRKTRRHTTKGWELLIRWKDGSETWTNLKDMKESFPVETAEYSIQARIHEEPAFAWWVPHVISKRKAIISKVKSKYWSRTHKYGIRIPKTVKEAKMIDAENGNSLWWDAICDEMKNVRIAFEEFQGPGIPVGHKKIDCHMIFDVKLGENYRRKARLVAGGHKTEAPASITYSSVVSRDSVRIALLIAAMNDLEVLACDIQNAYLTAPCREKVFTVAGDEFGSDSGKTMLITRALYGLKSAGASFRAFLGEHLHDMGYRPCLADPDVWLRPAVKKCGFEYYEYVLTYVDDCLAISDNPKATMEGIQSKFKLKNDKFAEPTDYLGATLAKMTTASDTECWTQSSDKYVMASIQSVEAKLAEKGNKLPIKCVTPFSSGYRPESDTSPELGAEGHRYYQELIGMLRWAVEIGRLDILLEVSMLSHHLALPREGHLEQVMHIFGYLKQHPKRKIAFDPDHPVVDERRFKEYDWFDFYRDAKEAIPTNSPPPRGKSVSTHCFVDASLANDQSTRRSQTGILIFVNRAPVLWYSKRQNTVETSTFGSEIVALKNAIELIEGLRYKLRMMGVEVDGPTNIYCDNEAVTKNCSIPESTLKKKHHSIAYHRNREAVAAGTCRIAKEDTATNLADVFTKVMSSVSRNELFDKFMY